MRSHVNQRQLVLRVDSATGYAKVGWAVDLPAGRFVHVEVIGEAQSCEAVTHDGLPHDSPLYENFLSACSRARNINRPLINEQKKANLAKGFLPVPLDLNDSKANTAPDIFGSYQEAAMSALFRLTSNFALAWAVINRQTVFHLRSCRPPQPMEELQFQVWKRHTLNALSQFPGEIIAGNLIIQESGLWFCPQPDLDDVPNYSPSGQ